MSKLTYQQRSNQSTRIPVGQRRTVGGKVLEDNRAAFAAKQLKQDETAQRTKEEDEDERLKGKSAAQLAKKDEEETGQAKFSGQAPPVQREEKDSTPNNTGLPDKLKNGIESLSGLSMDNVKVHYNSAKPSQLNALAYAQGTDIHVAQGQEKHLPHEAWHVVQQAQGRVKPTMQMKEGMPVNDDKSLEHEADVMGEMAVTKSSKVIEQASGRGRVQPPKSSPEISNKAIIQNKLRFESEEEDTKGKYVQSSLEVYEEIRHYVNLQFRGGYYNFGSEEHTLAIGMLHGQLIKWANDETPRPPYRIAEAVRLAAVEREDFKNLVRESKNIQEDLDLLLRLEYQLENFNYKDTQPADRRLMVQLAAGNIATKTNKPVVLEKALALQHQYRVKINTGEAELKAEEDAFGFLCHMASRADTGHAQAYFSINYGPIKGPFTPAIGKHAEDSMAPALGSAYQEFKGQHEGKQPDYIFIYSTYSPCHKYVGTGSASEHSCSNLLSTATNHLPVNKKYYMGYSSIWGGTDDVIGEARTSNETKSREGLQMLKSKGIGIFKV